MNSGSLVTVLRAVGLLMYGMVAVEYLALEIFLAPPVIIATVLIVLSFFFGRFPKAIAYLSLASSVLVPISAGLGVALGQIPLFVLLFDVVVFGWLGWTAISFLRKPTSGKQVTKTSD